jgi:hypothetical protein
MQNIGNYNMESRTETLQFQGVEREYDVLDRNYWNEKGMECPCWWIMYSPEQKRVFISDEVERQDYRQHMVFHELYEFETPEMTHPELVGKGFKMKCSEALQKELARVPKDDLQEYLAFRTGVFRELVRYWDSRISDPDKEKILSEARESLRMLENLVDKR